jgi:hypothetical protein
MSDANELGALKASLRGALATGEPLAGLRDRVEAIDPRGDVTETDLEELARLSAAHALAAAALRGLVETMIARRAGARS